MKRPAILWLALACSGGAPGCGGRVHTSSQTDRGEVDAGGGGRGARNTSPVETRSGESEGGSAPVGDAAGPEGPGEREPELPRLLGEIEVWVGQVEAAVTFPEDEDQEPQRVVLVLELGRAPMTGGIRFGDREAPAPRGEIWPDGPGSGGWLPWDHRPLEGFEYTLFEIYVEGERLEASFASSELGCAMGWTASCPAPRTGLVRLDLVRQGDVSAGKVLRQSGNAAHPAIRLRRVE